MHSISIKLTLLVASLFYRWGNWGGEKLSHLVVRGVGGIWTYAICFQRLHTSVPMMPPCGAAGRFGFSCLCNIVSLTSHQWVNEFKVLVEYIPTILDSISGQACFFPHSMVPSLVANLCLSCLIPSTHNDSPMVDPPLHFLAKCLGNIWVLLNVWWAKWLKLLGDLNRRWLGCRSRDPFCLGLQVPRFFSSRKLSGAWCLGTSPVLESTP